MWCTGIYCNGWREIQFHSKVIQPKQHGKIILTRVTRKKKNWEKAHGIYEYASIYVIRVCQTSSWKCLLKVSRSNSLYFDCKRFTAGNFQRVSPACRTAVLIHLTLAITIPLCTSLWTHSKLTGDKNIFVELLLFWHPYHSSWHVSAPHQRCEAAARMSRGRCNRSEEAPLFQEYEFQAVRSRNAGSSLCPWCKYDRKNPGGLCQEICF